MEHPDTREAEGRHTYTCGHCNTNVCGIVVAKYYYGHTVNWVLCTNCGYGSAVNDGRLFPEASFGPVIGGLPEPIREAYEEARNCMSVGAYTASELICRNVLMYVAVQKGAKEGESFSSYLSFLAQEGYVTPPMRKWVDLIRENGNKSAHDLEQPDRTRAESTVSFTAELLRLTYEMEHLANRYVTDKNKPETAGS